MKALPEAQNSPDHDDHHTMRAFNQKVHVRSMEEMTHQQVAGELIALGSDCGPGEFHGFVVARAALFGASEAMLPREVVMAWLEVSALSDSLHQVASSLYETAVESLEEFSDFDLALLLPDDETAMDDRFSELTCWCNGFLEELQASQSSNDWLMGPDYQEMLSDLSQIGQSLDPVPDSEANENDYFEIIEYVRVVVLSVATEAQRSKMRLR